MGKFDDIIQEINDNLADNTTQAITAKKLRDTLVDFTNTVDEVQTEFEDGVDADVQELKAQIGTYTLIEPTDSIRGYIIDGENGQLISSAKLMQVKTYSIDSSKTYKANGYIGRTLGTVMIAYYEDETYISGEVPSPGGVRIVTDYIMTIPSNANIVRIEGAVGSGYQVAELYEFSKGTISSDIIKLQTDVAETQTDVAETQTDVEEIKAQIGGNTLIDPTDTVRGYIINGETGQLMQSINIMQVKTYSIDPTKKYIANGSIGRTLGTIMIAYYEGETYISGEIPSPGGIRVITNYIMTVPSNANVVRIEGMVYDGYQIAELYEFPEGTITSDIVKLQNDVEDIKNTYDESNLFRPRMYNPIIDLKKENLKILDIGNSYTVDCQHYLPNIISADGLPTTGYSLYRYLRAGSSFKTIVECYNDSDVQTYSINKIIGDTISGVQTGTAEAGDGTLFRQALNNCEWDLILIHQVSDYANDYSLWFGDGDGGYLKELIQILKTTNPQASIGTYLVHSYRSTYSKNTEKSSLLRWQNICKSIIKFINNTGIDFIIPYGTAVQNLRATSLNDQNEFSTDGTHMADGLGDYVAACCYYQSLFAPRFGKSIMGNLYRDTSVDTTKAGVKVIDDANALLAQKAAMLATYNMFQINNPETQNN